MSGQVTVPVSATNTSSRIDTLGKSFSTSAVLHFTYYFRHVSVAQNNDTVYIVAIRVLEELANHSRTFNFDSGNF